MYRLLILFLATFVAIRGSVVEFLQLPNDIELQNDARLSSSDVPVVISNLMGLTADKPQDWTPKTNIWKRPEAAVVFVVKTPQHLKLKLQSAQAYKLDDNDLPDFSEISSTIEDTFFDDVATVLNVNTDIYGQNSDAIKLLKKQPKDDATLTGEFTSVVAVEDWVVAEKSTIRNGVPDLFVFEIDGLNDLSMKGAGSEQMDEAVNNLKRIVKEVTNNFLNVYDGNVIVCVVAGSGAKIRRPRAAAAPTAAGSSTPATPGVKPPTTYNFYDQNYPVIFNIILWTMLALSVAILFIATSMWFMDPGRDSIIYRMTMTRAKKD